MATQIEDLDRPISSQFIKEASDDKVIIISSNGQVTTEKKRVSVL